MIVYKIQSTEIKHKTVEQFFYNHAMCAISICIEIINWYIGF